MVRVPNINGLFNARYGYYDGKKYVFTHRDPDTGALWGEDIPVGKNPVEFGKWVQADQVRLIWTDDDGNEIIEPKKNKKKKGKRHG